MMISTQYVDDTNTTSELLNSFDNIEDAKTLAIEEVKNTNPDNENEGINIYDESGMLISYFGEDVTVH